MKLNSFGLDIGATTIKAVWLSEEKGKFSFNSASCAPTPPKGLLTDSPMDQAELALSIRKMVFEAKINAKFINISLPENQVYTKIVEMPVLSDKELYTAILWEAEQHIPVPLETVTLDWKVLKRPENPNQGINMQVLLVGAPTALIEKYKNIFSLTGFTLASIETEILSVIRATMSLDNSPNTLLIHIGALTTSIAIIKNGILIFTYSVATGGTTINRAIATEFGFTISEAEEYKKTYGFSKNTTVGEKIEKAIQPVLTSILVEVKKALTFFSEKYKDEESIRQIALSGGTAKLTGLDLFFAQNCNIETVVVNPWKTIIANEALPQQLISNGPDYTIAIGLAMKKI